MSKSLMKQYTDETGKGAMRVYHHDHGPTIEYVEWLEKRQAQGETRAIGGVGEATLKDNITSYILVLETDYKARSIKSEYVIKYLRQLLASAPTEHEEWDVDSRSVTVQEEGKSEGTKTREAMERIQSNILKRRKGTATPIGGEKEDKKEMGYSCKEHSCGQECQIETSYHCGKKPCTIYYGEASL